MAENPGGDLGPSTEGLGWLRDMLGNVVQEQQETRKVINIIQRDLADLRVEVAQNYMGRGDCHNRHVNLESLLAKELASKADKGALTFGWQVAVAIGGGLTWAAGVALAVWKLLAS